MLRHERLCGYKHERVLDEPAYIVASFVLCPFERVGAQVEQVWQAQFRERLCPYIETVGLLFEKDRLPLVIAETGQIAIVGPIEEFMALIRTFTG
jgi:hypothetical protein